MESLLHSLGLFLICLLHYSVSSITSGYLAVLLYPHHAEQCLAHSRHSLNICGMSKYRWGEPSQCAEWLDGLVAWGGSYSLCLGPALGKQASLCPDSHCLRTVCRWTGQAWAATLPRPQDSLRQAAKAAIPQRELVKKRVKKLFKQA